MKVLVGSTNPVKIEAVKEAFSKYFEDIQVEGIEVASGVSAQPVNEETFEGAKNRALELARINDEKNLGAEYFVGIEGGIIELYSTWFAFGGMCIIDSNGRKSFGSSSHFPLPQSIINELLEGKELGIVMDKITGEHNTKQKDGAIGFFTRNKMNRKELYVDGLTVALIPFLNEDLFF